MIEYIYFVKCPGCEDEMFHFFDEAKEFALGSMTKKPVITQIEVHRNDFGECVDSVDLGTVWTYEQIMSDIPEASEETVFSKSETFNASDWDVAADLAGFTDDVEAYDFNTKDPIKKRPLPAEMTIEALVEEMEELEDMVECKECYDLKPKSDCKYEEGRGYVCTECSSRSVKEAVAKIPETVELHYDDLEITIFGERRAADDWDEKEVTVDFVYKVDKDDVATFMWESCLTEEDVKDVPGGLDALYADDTAWENFIDDKFDNLFEKYEKQILDYYREAATEKCQENTTWDDYFAGPDPDDIDESCKIITEALVSYFPHLANVPDAKDQIINEMKTDYKIANMLGGNFTFVANYDNGYSTNLINFNVSKNGTIDLQFKDNSGSVDFESIEDAVDGMRKGCSAYTIISAISKAADKINKRYNVQNPRNTELRNQNVGKLLRQNPAATKTVVDHVERIVYRIPIVEDEYILDSLVDNSGEPLTDRAKKKILSIYNNFFDRFPYAEEAEAAGMVINRLANLSDGMIPDTNYGIASSWGPEGKITFDRPIKDLPEVHDIIKAAKALTDEEAAKLSSETSRTIDCVRLANELIKHVGDVSVFSSGTADRLVASLDTKKQMLETLEESEDYNKRLTMCPECGATSFDYETGICINCGFSVLEEDLTDTDIKNIANITKRIVERETDELLDRVNEVGNTVSIHHQVISKGLDNLQKED